MEHIIQDFAENVNGLVKEKLKKISRKEAGIEELEQALKEELDNLGLELCN